MKMKSNNILQIVFTKNNIFLNLHLNESKIFIFSSGLVGFEGSQRFTKDAFKRILKVIFKILKKKKITHLILKIKGIAFFFKLNKMAKACKLRGLHLKKIIIIGFLPHNGCRSSKRQRLKQKTNYILP